MLKKCSKTFAPGQGDIVSCSTSNCFYPFMVGTVYVGNPGTSTTPPAFGGFVKVDYALPRPYICAPRKISVGVQLMSVEVNLISVEVQLMLVGSN